MKSIVVSITTVIEVGDNVKVEEIKNNNDLNQVLQLFLQKQILARRPFA
jgi:hypothetical protein